MELIHLGCCPWLRSDSYIGEQTLAFFHYLSLPAYLGRVNGSKSLGLGFDIKHKRIRNQWSHKRLVGIMGRVLVGVVLGLLKGVKVNHKPKIVSLAQVLGAHIAANRDGARVNVSLLGGGVKTQLLEIQQLGCDS
mgnify:CR=1 FL=1